MRISEIMTPSFRALRQELGLPRPAKAVVQVSADSDFCREVVARGWLTEEQMAHAAERYRLGRSKSGHCIFWMINEMGRVYDGHIGNSWVSAMLKAREPELLKDWHTEHCLFGTQMIGHTDRTDHTDGCSGSLRSKSEENLEKNLIKPHTAPSDCTDVVAVVESERSAVILSEVLPEYIWLASVYPMNLNVRTLQPLCGRRVVLFPPTDETGETFLAWVEVADQARRVLHLDISVSTVLEERATEEQKRRKIDLIGFLF